MPCQVCLFIGSLPSNGCPIFDSICFRNMFNEPLHTMDIYVTILLIFCAFPFLINLQCCLWSNKSLAKIFFSSILRSSVIYSVYSFFAVLRQSAHHFCPLILVQFTIPEDMFLRLQPVTTFAFSRGHNVKSIQACFKTGVFLFCLRIGPLINLNSAVPRDPVKFGFFSLAIPVYLFCL
jgi:hypothetical protein